MKLLTTEDIASALRERVETTQRRLARGEMVASKIGRRWFVDEDEFNRFVARKVKTPDKRKRRSR